MKKVLKRIATMATALALIVITGITMAACGSNGGSNNSNNSGNSSNTTTNICNVDNLNGFYANIAEQKLYYFENTVNGDLGGLQGEFSLVSEEPDENGLYHLRVRISNWPDGGKYAAKLEVNYGTQAVTIYHQWSEKKKTLLIRTYDNEYDNDLSKQFYAEDEKIVYTKISGLDEFLAEVFPDKDIDTTDMTHVDNSWEDLIEAL